MLLIVEKGRNILYICIRRGILDRYAKANNKYIEDYDKNKGW